MGFEAGGAALAEMFGSAAAEEGIGAVAAEGIGSAAAEGIGGAAAEGIGGGAVAGSSFGLSDATYGLSDIPSMSVGGDTLGMAGQFAGGLLGLSQGQQVKSASKGIDPFGPYRGTFAAMLSTLMQNPNMVTSMPGYEAGMKAGEQALTRNLASQGLTGSGTAAQALTEFGAKYQDTAFQQLFSQLSQLSGANFNNAGTALQGRIAGMQTQNDSIGNLTKILPVLMNSFGG